MSRRSANTSRPTPDRATGQTSFTNWVPPFLRSNWLGALFLVLATILAYHPAWHAGYIWDDDIYVTGNQLLTAPDGLRRIWFSLDSPSQYFPLVYTTFRLERALWGLHPAGYHWVNILLHAANALLVWRLLKGLRVPGAWLAAALFALHPVHVESVAWITERKNVLMGFFFLFSLLAWSRFVEGREKKFYLLALICYVLALFSKTTACTLPAVLLLVLWLQGKTIDWRRVAQVAPFVLLGIGMGLLAIWWERHHQGTQGEIFAIAFPERLLVASRALWFYAWKLLWPAHLAFSYPRWTISTANAFDYVWLAATAAVGVAIYFARRYFGRGPAVALLFFAANLSPMLGFIMLYTFRYSFVADHYQYIASMGLLALAAAGITTAGAGLKRNQQLLLALVCGGWLLALGVKTSQQAAIYASEETLWEATIAENPQSWMAYNNRGIRHLRAGRVEEAIADYRKALEINQGYAEAHFNLGNALVRTNRVEEGIAHYHRAVEIFPGFAAAHFNRGSVLQRLGRLEEAATHYERALEINPNLVAAHTGLGTVLRELGRSEEAEVHLEKARTLKSK